ncbi:glutathione S-transferase [Luteimonas sp. 3794]|nr:glutathione S-transferase [Luteimonas sp. 3794]
MFPLRGGRGADRHIFSGVGLADLTCGWRWRASRSARCSRSASTAATRWFRACSARRPARRS